MTDIERDLVRLEQEDARLRDQLATMLPPEEFAAMLRADAELTRKSEAVASAYETIGTVTAELATVARG